MGQQTTVVVVETKQLAVNMDLSKSEQRVLDVLWNEQPLTVGQVIERLQKDSDWHENTIKTLLTRLVQKKAVARRKEELQAKGLDLAIRPKKRGDRIKRPARPPAEPPAPPAAPAP